MGDLYRIYLGSIRDDIHFHLASIPTDFDVEPTEEFDPIYMRALFDRGKEMARDGCPWADSPPGIELRTSNRVPDAADPLQP